MAAVIGAIRIWRGWFQTGESFLPCPQRQAQAPREISSKVPAMREWSEALRILPVTKPTPSVLLSSNFNQLGHRVTSLLRIAIQSAFVAFMPRFTAAAKPRLLPRRRTVAP